MKDIENRHQVIISRVKSLARNEGVPYFRFDRLQTIAQESGYLCNENLIGAGQECVVVTNQQTPEAVMAFTYQDMDPIEARKTFYVHRIFSTLFPHNFPHFFASFGGDYSRTIRQRIYPANSDDTQVQFPFSKVMAEVVFNWGIRGGGISAMHFDSAPFNYVVAVDGGEYFLDRISLKQYGANHNIEQELTSEGVRNNITHFMQEKAFSDDEMKVVYSSINRLVELGKMKA